jgi:hypothetical protein
MLTARSLTWLTPYLLINQADDATVLTTEITGTVSGSDVSFTIPALTTATIGGVPGTAIPAGQYPTHLTLRVTAGGAQAVDGKWSGWTVIDGGKMLATIEDLKGYLSINHSNSDADLWAAVVAASKWFETQVGRTIASTSYVEIQDGLGGKTIIPSNYPVISVSAVSISGTAATLSTGYGVSGYYLSGNVIRFRDQFVSEGEGNVSVSYVGGYATIPDDVRSAVTEVAAVMFRERDRAGQQSKVFGGETVTYYYAPPARVVSTVESYRRTL